MHRKKKKRSLNTIGIDNYDFDYQLEKSIYCYLCCIKTNNRAIKKLEETLKFNTYSEWEQYVRNKHSHFSDDKLKEFNRYLNQRIRNVKPNRDYGDVMIPVLITLLTTEVIDYFKNFKVTLPSEMSILAIIIAVLTFVILLLIALIPIIILLGKTVAPIWDNHTEENLLNDYKEIINSMIDERNKSKDTNHQ